MDRVEYRTSLQQMHHVLSLLDETQGKIVLTLEKMKTSLVVNEEAYMEERLQLLKKKIAGMKEQIQNEIIPSIERDLEHSKDIEED